MIHVTVNITLKLKACNDVYGTAVQSGAFGAARSVKAVNRYKSLECSKRNSQARKGIDGFLSALRPTDRNKRRPVSRTIIALSLLHVAAKPSIISTWLFIATESRALYPTKLSEHLHALKFIPFGSCEIEKIVS